MGRRSKSQRMRVARAKCRTKVRYETEDEVRSAIERFAHKSPPPLAWYQCAVCNGWHKTRVESYLKYNRLANP